MNAAAKAAAPKPKPVHLRIAKIELCDFQAFPGPDVTPIHLQQFHEPSMEWRGKGRSLLLYGENGSGKSSLGRALRDMLESSSSRSMDFDKCVHVFSDPPCNQRGVTLHFDDSRQKPSVPMEWHPGNADHRNHPLFAAMAKSRGWMDYRTLWAALRFQRHFDYADIFTALAETLLMDCEIPAANNRTFGVLWQDIVRIAEKRPTKAYGSIGNLNWLEANIEDFGTKLGAFLPDLEARANELLASFVPWTAVTLKLERRPAYNSRVKRMKFTTGVVSLKVTYRGRPLAKLDGFLNEARITAIALSLFLSALTLSTPPRIASPGGDVYFPRLLVLDDVLISLDMAHRRPLLNVLMQHFKDWQVFLLTHDREWYEIAKNTLPNGEWRFAEIHSVPWGEHEQPLIKGDVPHLQRARDFLRQGEIKAAAVHVRTQFELVLKEACRELSLQVVYVDDPKRWDASHFWNTVKAHWKARPEMSKIVADVTHSLSWVLNPHSHSRPVSQIRREIQEAVEAVANLEVAVTSEIAAKSKEAAAKSAEKAQRKGAEVPIVDPEWAI